MNRAEAHDYMWYKNEECPSMRWGNHATIRDYVDVMIDEIYDSFEEQIQGLQSLLDLKQQYIDIVRKGKATTQYQNLRSVESEAVIRMCEEKIKLANTNKRVNVGQRVELRNKLEKYNN